MCVSPQTLSPVRVVLLTVAVPQALTGQIGPDSRRDFLFLLFFFLIDSVFTSLCIGSSSSFCVKQ